MTANSKKSETHSSFVGKPIAESSQSQAEARGGGQERPRVSVVIPVYNTDHKQLTDCLASVLSQNLDNYEVIAVNDGSPDRKIRPILRKAAQAHPHLKVVSQRNAGGAAAINRGIKEARGEYLTIMDHDDIMLSGALNALYRAAHEADADMATGRLQRLEGQADFWPTLTPLFDEARVLDSPLEDTRILNNIHYYNWIYRRDLFDRRVGAIKKRIVADFEMMHLMIPFANRIAIIPQTVYLWRRTKNSITSTQGFFRDRIQVIRDVIRANEELPADYKSALFLTLCERLSWYEPKYFDLNEPERTTALATCLFDIFNYLEAAGLDPVKELAATSLSTHQKSWFSLAMTETEEEAVRAFRKEAIRRAEATVRKQEAAKARLDQQAAVQQALAARGLSGKLHKARLTTVHMGKLASLKAKGLAMRHGFERNPELFAKISRMRKRGYRAPLREAETRITQSSKAVFFESFLGKQYGGNPRAIYEYMQKHHPEYEFYWCYHGDAQDIPGNPTVVRRESKEYWEALARCHKLVNNVVFPNWYYGTEKRYLQTWHGTPLKRLGFDIEVAGPETQARYGFYNESRNWDALISANHHSTECFARAFRFRKDMLTIGYPANDVFYQPERLARMRRAVRKKLKIPPSAQVILYAPTWRDHKSVGNWSFSFELTPDFSELLNQAGLKKTYVLERHHHLTERQGDGDDKRIINVSDYPDAHELMVAADILVSDYSSIAFDWACSRKPVVFYTPDYEEYNEAARGFYLDMESDLNAQLVRDEQGLIDVLRDAPWNSPEWEAQTNTLYERFCDLHDGTASQQAVEWLLREEKA